MKFIHYLESIAGISIYPLVSLLIFFLFFVGLIVYVAKTDKKTLAEMQQIPLDASTKM